MAYENFRVETGSDGIAIVTWDSPDRSMNIFTAKVMQELDAIVDQVVADASVKGAVIVSAKKDFSGGADITMIHALFAVFEKRMKEDPK
jgi:3-hydroxyacyl-CoA dehydrogenase/enoyl-CoA hydratase/3-hydroxybutyryl-CoA epimerase